MIVYKGSSWEWKRRYEKERDKNTKMKAIIAKLEAELQVWRSGK